MRLGFLTAALLWTPAVVTAQTVDEIVARHITARGGMEKITAIQTLKITRTIATGIGSNVRVTLYKKRPNLFRAEQTLATPGASMTARGVNAGAAWDTAPGGKITLRPDAAAAEARDLDGDFDGLLVNWKDKGHAVSFDGKESMPGGDVLKLRVKTKAGVERIIFLDAAT